VTIKAEPDGRMFPLTDRSETIIDCLTQSAQRAGVKLCPGARVEGIEIDAADQTNGRFLIRLLNGDCLPADQLLIATGNSHDGHAMAASLGHTIVPCVPSLFTFKVQDSELTQLSGLSVQDADLVLTVGDGLFKQRGPVLITHWGLSGPAILKLSAWAARELAETRYQARLQINWFAGKTSESCRDLLKQNHGSQGKKLVSASGLEPIPRRLWSFLVKRAGIADSTLWSNLSRANIDSLAGELTGMSVGISGKGQFKEEFVTCGGVSLKEIDFRTMQSRIVPGLYFAGEILDIDGITGGFNFQSAWTTGWLAGTSMAATI
jgi:predicted Rossmann fold flavoprotein